MTGPVTYALSAMRTEPDPPRRTLLAVASAALAGTVFGITKPRAGIDMSAVAEAWIEDARDLGMLVLRGPDGKLWRATPYGDGDERQAARERHWIKLNERSSLMRAVRVAVEGGFEPAH